MTSTTAESVDRLVYAVRESNRLMELAASDPNVVLQPRWREEMQAAIQVVDNHKTLATKLGV